LKKLLTMGLSFTNEEPEPESDIDEPEKTEAEQLKKEAEDLAKQEEEAKVVEDGDATTKKADNQGGQNAGGDPAPADNAGGDAAPADNSGDPAPADNSGDPAPADNSGDPAPADNTGGDPAPAEPTPATGDKEADPEAGKGADTGDGGDIPAPVDQEEKEEEEKPFVAVRREIRSMSKEDQQRFANALKRMMKNDNGVDSSEFYRIASYHGMHCAHRNESFPVWHRPYLCEMEKALQEADKKLGNDGLIALPYWDWTARNTKELIPKIVREQFPHVKGLYSDPDWQLNNWAFEFPTDRELKQKLESAKVDSMVTKCLLEDEHYKHASATQGSNSSVESPHDRIHVATGWPMTSVSLAAFNPLFYLHHCNVDRIFQKYLTIETDSRQEFESNQDIQEENGKEDLYEKWCEPFYLDKEKKIKFLPSHGYGPTEKLGFVYDELPPTPGDQMRETPVVALFQNVDMMKLKKKSYAIHVFCQPKDEMDKAPALPEKEVDFAKDKRYAGWAAIFGGRGVGCHNCETGNPVNKWVVLNDALFNLGKTAYDVKLVCVCFDERNVQMKFEDCAGVPIPKIRGPYFTDKQEMTSETDKDMWQGEAYMVQKYLKKYGYYKGKMDGWFGKKTCSAVELFQKNNPASDGVPLDVDGIAGPQTKGSMNMSRYDDKPDIVWLNLDDEKEAKQASPNYAKGSTITYGIGTFPGYLDAKQARKDVENAIAQWNNTGIVKFKECDKLDDADVKIMFSNLSPKNDRVFDGRGGMLAESDKNHVYFDNSERWLTSTSKEADGGVSRKFRIQEVCVHELGHVLGLGHSNNRNDVMAPYYNSGKVELAKADIATAEGMYK